jgi:hypothetical protein
MMMLRARVGRRDLSMTASSVGWVEPSETHLSRTR